MNWTLWGFHLHLNTFIFKNEERCVSLHFRPVILNYGYTRNRNVLTMWFLAGNQGNHQNFDPSLLANNLWRFFMRIKQKKFLFSKKIFKMADSKKVRFSKSPILNVFLWKFHESVLGLVGLIDAKGIDLSQPIWLWGCPT